jgi:hypothetical protein
MDKLQQKILNIRLKEENERKKENPDNLLNNLLDNI